jgi:Ca-activated chloride channel family protein
LWVRPDQQGYEAMQAQRPGAAAELFKDPQWRAAAEYRSGDYGGSVATLSSLDTVEANYNRGNALARAGQLEPAIQAYDRAIELDPAHEDALYNRALVEDLLEQQQQNQDQQNQQSGSDDQEQNSENSADSGEQQEDGESDSEERDGDSGDESQRNRGSGEENRRKAGRAGRRPCDCPRRCCRSHLQRRGGYIALRAGRESSCRVQKRAPCRRAGPC